MSKKPTIFFDNASTTRCLDTAAEALLRYSTTQFGNPSSSHAPGQAAARAIHEAKLAFGSIFRVNPEQVVFTGGGTEADNLAIYGVAMETISRRTMKGLDQVPRVVCGAIEHPAVLEAMRSLATLGFDVQIAPALGNGQVDAEALLRLVTPATQIVSIQLVNNIVGSVMPVEELARRVKEIAPKAVFHTDAVQAFGKVPMPVAPSPVDLVSVSAHKIEGPKGVGALVFLNKDLFRRDKGPALMRPLVYGGGQEAGWRSGTQSAGLIAAFRIAADHAILHRERNLVHARQLRGRLEQQLKARGLLSASAESAPLTVRWNSPVDGVPHIVNLSVPGFPSGPLARMMEERGCVVSSGSACNSARTEPDSVLQAMGLPLSAQTSAIRVSFAGYNQLSEIDVFVAALQESIQQMSQLLGGGGGASARH